MDTREHAQDVSSALPLAITKVQGQTDTLSFTANREREEERERHKNGDTAERRTEVTDQRTEDN